MLFFNSANDNVCHWELKTLFGDWKNEDTRIESNKRNTAYRSGSRQNAQPEQTSSLSDAQCRADLFAGQSWGRRNSVEAIGYRAMDSMGMLLKKRFRGTQEGFIMTDKRAERVAKHRADMPNVYRGIYDRAVSGKSLRAAVNSFCLECVMYQREEVRLCTSLACPLWLHRPYQRNSKTPSDGLDFAPESKNSGQGDLG